MLIRLIKYLLPGKWRLEARAILKLKLTFVDQSTRMCHYSVLFFTKPNGKRKYKVAHPPASRRYDPGNEFTNTVWNGDLVAWKAGGNMPDWADDILLERLSK